MDRDEREKAILEAALSVFGRKGYADTRMADIAKEAGMSYGLVYHYFANKEALFDALAEEWWRGFYEQFQTLRSAPLPTEEKLSRVISYVLKVYGERPDFISLFVTEISRGFAYHGHSRGRDQFNELFNYCNELMAEGQEKGLLRKDTEARYLTYIFLGAIDTILAVMILGKERLSKKREERIISAITKVFLEGARAKNTGNLSCFEPKGSEPGLNEE